MAKRTPDFDTKPLKDFCSAIIDCPHSTPPWLESGKLVLRNFNIRDGHIDLSEPSYTDETTFNQRNMRVKPKAGDLVISREAPMGEVAIIPEGLECCLGQRMVLLRPNLEICDSRYLLYAILSEYVQTQIRWNDASGSIVSNLCIPDLAGLKIPWYDLDVQKAIGETLSMIDEKIANNKNLMEELEATTRLIYDYWFTQFDFPDENGKPYRSSGGNMTWSDELKRSIPKEWTIGTLGDYLHLEKDTVTPTPGHTYEHYSIPAFDDGKFPTLDDGGSIESGKYRVQKGCILYSKLNPKFKRLWRPYCLTDDAICSTEFLVMQPDAPQYQGFCISILYSPAFYAHMVSKAISSTGSRSRVDPDVAISFAFARPADKLIERYGAHVMPLFSQIQELEIENHELANMRDWLLPMLMNGQATIGE